MFSNTEIYGDQSGEFVSGSVLGLQGLGKEERQ